MVLEQVYLHIGTHKTGSTALQWFFIKNQPLLAVNGYLYPGSILNGVAHHPLAWALMPDQPNYAQHKEPAESLWHKAVTEAEAKSCAKLIVSSEDFWHLTDVTKLASLFAGVDVRIVVYLRRQDQFVQSAYNMMVKWEWSRRTGTLEKYLEDVIQTRYLDYAARLQPWADAFGQANIIVRPYEKAQFAGSIFQDFCASIGIPWQDDFVLPQQDVNPPLAPKALEFLRILNELPLQQEQHHNIVELLAQYSQLAKPGREHFAEHGLLTVDEQTRLMETFAGSNQVVARTYLGRPDGQLFHEPLPTDSLAGPADRQLSLRDVVHILGCALAQRPS